MVACDAVHGNASTHVGRLDLSLRILHGCLSTRNHSLPHPLASMDVDLFDGSDGHVGIVGSA